MDAVLLEKIFEANSVNMRKISLPTPIKSLRKNLIYHRLPITLKVKASFSLKDLLMMHEKVFLITHAFTFNQNPSLVSLNIHKLSSLHVRMHSQHINPK